MIILDCMNWNEHQINWLETVLDDSISNTYHVIICNHYSPNAKVHGLTECGFESIYTDNSEFYIGNSIADNLADLVQTKINNGLKFICYLFGHFHLDKFGYIVKYPNQYYVCVDKTSGGDYWERDSARLYGKAVDAFDVISVDTTFEILTILRIGQNRDKFMRPKNYLTFDYKNSKLISHS